MDFDEKRHSDKNIDYEIKRSKALEQEIGCEFTRIAPDKKKRF